MKLFKLPDLGEGLPDAEIREWYIKAGDDITVDQPMVAMETAKALVDVPAPFSGKIEKLFGEVGDTIETGHALVGFEGEGDAELEKQDTGTVVGEIKSSNKILEEIAIGITTQPAAQQQIRATPNVRAFARNVGIDINTITPKGERIMIQDIKDAMGHPTISTVDAPVTMTDPNMQKLSNARRAMAMSMAKSHQEIVPVTIVDDADIYLWQGKHDITIRLIRALQTAVEQEPMLNISFDGPSMSYKLNEKINLGLAIDSPHGLFVPVLKDIQAKSDQELRQMINEFKQQAQSKSIRPDDLRGATIMLSNFGSLAGRYANPIIIQPMVAIIGIGKKRDSVVAHNGNAEIHPIIPISVSSDHRAVTGGEAARFLFAMISALALN